ncbi:MAG: tetratricopeptide repeat protein, partial [Chloroflexota bacterium]|nr:tetratricopeptide repeat protein [Chloroflexota bacterium]
ADPAGVSVLVWSLGEVKRGQGDFDAAQRLLEEALARMQGHGHHAGVCYALASLGHLALVSGDFGRAVSLQLECLALRQTVDLLNIPHCLDELAMVAAAMGDMAKAARLFGAAAAKRAHAGGAPWPLTLADRGRLLAAARVGLGDATFDAAWQVGGRFSLAQAIGEAAELGEMAIRPAARPSVVTVPARVQS